MRALLKPRVLKTAGLAAALTALASWPRLAAWEAPPHQVWFLVVVLVWAAFILWSFVFAWFEPHTGGPVFARAFEPRMWVAAIGCGVAGALILRWTIDPWLRPLMPTDYPASWGSWADRSLFLLAFGQLFLCFAPLALFARLTRNPGWAAFLTVVLGVLVLFLKTRSLAERLPPELALAVFAWRVLASAVSVVLFLRGGALPVYGWLLLLQCRHLPAFAAP